MACTPGSGICLCFLMRAKDSVKYDTSAPITCRSNDVRLICLWIKKVCERRGSNPYAEALDPKSSVYANFTTLACCIGCGELRNATSSSCPIS